MTLRGLPFLVDKPTLYRDVFGVDRGEFRKKVKAGRYPLLVWVNDCGTLKVTRQSLERQLEAMRVKAAA